MIKQFFGILSNLRHQFITGLIEIFHSDNRITSLIILVVLSMFTGIMWVVLGFDNTLSKTFTLFWKCKKVDDLHALGLLISGAVFFMAVLASVGFAARYSDPTTRDKRSTVVSLLLTLMSCLLLMFLAVTSCGNANLR